MRSLICGRLVSVEESELAVVTKVNPFGNGMFRYGTLPDLTKQALGEIQRSEPRFSGWYELFLCASENSRRRRQ